MTTDQHQEILRTEGLSKFFPGVKALDNVDFSLRRGEIMALLGENGAGKSTLLKILSGLARPSLGTVERGARDTETGYLGHGTFLYPRLTARENLFFWGRMQGLPEKSVKTLQC